MFQFPESRLSAAICSLQDIRALSRMGSPIRTSTDRCMLTAPRRISLFAASFFASLCLGIRHTLFPTLPTVSYTHLDVYKRQPIDGSSNNSNFGRDIKDLPIASICCSPPDSVPANWCLRSFKRGNLL